MFTKKTQTVITPPAVIFDFDGTLADSHDYVIRGSNRFLATYSLGEVNTLPELRKKIWANAHRFHVRLLWLESLIREYVLDEIAAAVNEIKLQPSLAECIRDLHAKGFKLAILTTNRIKTVQEFLKQHGLSHYFDFIATCLNKNYAIKRIRLEKQLQDITYVTDESKDVFSLKGLEKTKTIAVQWGFEKFDTNPACKPDYTAFEPNDIISILTPTTTLKLS